MQITKWYCDLCGKEMTPDDSSWKLNLELTNGHINLRHDQVQFDLLCENCHNKIADKIENFFQDLRDYLNKEKKG